MKEIKTRLEPFGVWLRHQVEQSGTVSGFVAASGITPVWSWVRGWQVPKPWQIEGLAIALSQWTGTPMTTQQIRTKVNPDWRRVPTDFSGWLKRTIELKGSCNEFALKNGIHPSTVSSWVNGSSYPVGKVGQIDNLAGSLSDWTGKKITADHIRSRITADGRWDTYPDLIKKRFINASV